MVLKDIRGNDVQLTGPRMPRWGTTTAWHFGDSTDVAVSMPGGVRPRVGDIVVSQNYYSQGEIYTVSKVYPSGNVDLLYNTARFTTREMVFPVGHTYETTSTVNVNDFLPGTWVADPMNAYIPVLAGSTQRHYAWYINNVGQAAATGWRLDARSGRTDLTGTTPSWLTHVANGGVQFNIPCTITVDVANRFTGAPTNGVVGFSKSSTLNPDASQPFARTGDSTSAYPTGSFTMDIQPNDIIYTWVFSSASVGLVATASQAHTRKAISIISSIPTVYRWKRTA